MTTPQDDHALTPWTDLSAAEQLRLREAYGRYLDTLPPSCDLGVKLQRFRAWLAERGVRFDGAA